MLHPVPNQFSVLRWRICHITWGTPLEQGREKTAQWNLVWDPHSLNTENRLTILVGHHVPRPMPIRSWVPQAPGPLWKSGGSTGWPTIIYFNYTSDVLLFVFDWYYDVVCRKMYLYETGDDKDTCMYCLFCSQTILHVKSQETPSVHA